MQTAAAYQEDDTTSPSSNNHKRVVQRHVSQISGSAIHGATTDINQHPGILALLGNEVDQYPLPVVSIIWMLWYGGAAGGLRADRQTGVEGFPGSWEYPTICGGHTQRHTTKGYGGVVDRGTGGLLFATSDSDGNY